MDEPLVPTTLGQNLTDIELQEYYVTRRRIPFNVTITLPRRVED